MDQDAIELQRIIDEERKRHGITPETPRGRWTPLPDDEIEPLWVLAMYSAVQMADEAMR